MKPRDVCCHRHRRQRAIAGILGCGSRAVDVRLGDRIPYLSSFLICVMPDGETEGAAVVVATTAATAMCSGFGRAGSTARKTRAAALIGLARLVRSSVS